ncbi:hypothetical protein ACWD3J_47890 [Streptomyces sp. NPDC002755]
MELWDGERCPYRLLAGAAGHQRRFDARCAAYFDSLAGSENDALEVPPHGTFPARVLDLLREMSLRGGKRLRVALIHEAAISVELLHTHGLIHDAPVRRGGPSTYYAYRREFPDRPDTALAVLAGDLAAFRSVRVLSTSGLPPARVLAMAAVHADAGADRFARDAADRPAAWRGRWRPDAVAFLEHLPAWTVH